MRKSLFLSFVVASLAIIGCQANKEIVDLPRGSASPELSAGAQQCLDDAAAAGLEIHSLMVVKNGEVLFEKWQNGASADSAHVLNSVSKTFTSTAVGLAIADGKFSLDDKVVSFFPDQLPENPSENLLAMTVKDLLTMTCGHDTDPTGQIMRGGGDWVETFLSFPVEHTPGTFYCYNTLGTYVLSAIVQKTTGEKVLDYLTPRLFEPLHIAKPTWSESPQGINAGGFGLYLKTEDLAKMGQLLLQKGEWNGKQIVPSEWVEMASSKQTYSLPAAVREEWLEERNITVDNSDWLQGYGFQMWRCRHNAFRADGANGQYIIVIPEKNAVVAVTAALSDMQAEIDLIWDNILPNL